MDGINVIGYASANFGLGIAARNTIRLLTENGYAVKVADLQVDAGRSGQDHSCDRFMAGPGTELPYQVNLFHVNPPVLGKILSDRPSWLSIEKSLNVCVPFWELPGLPGWWNAELRLMDLVLAPSRFIEQAVATAACDPAPFVRHYPQTVFLPETHRPDRQRFGLPEKGVLFVMSFEIGSDIARKNPWAAIEASNAAFASADNAYLIVKLHNALIGPSSEKQLSMLREYAAANSHILIRDEQLGYDEVISLYKSCDVYVSLHRSEGLGLGPMEAMSLGKPVLATAWSGNMDFMDDCNSCLVGYRLVPVQSRVYNELMRGKEAIWADPNIAEASFWMRRLYELPDLRAAIGSRAQSDMVERRGACRKGRVFAMVQELYERKMQRIAAAKINKPKPGQAELFTAVADSIKKGDVEAAFGLYESSRPSLPETPELLRFDELMGQLREKTGRAHSNLL